MDCRYIIYAHSRVSLSPLKNHDNSSQVPGFPAESGIQSYISANIRQLCMCVTPVRQIEVIIHQDTESAIPVLFILCGL